MLVADGDIKNLWNNTVVSTSVVKSTMNNFTDAEAIAKDKAVAKERAGKITLGEWLDNNKIEKTKDNLIKFSNIDTYTEFITNIFNDKAA
jgi:hypothetical protein